jgi:hypothetical protein
MPKMIPPEENKYEKRVYLCLRAGIEQKVYDLFVASSKENPDKMITVFSTKDKIARDKCLSIIQKRKSSPERY